MLLKNGTTCIYHLRILIISISISIKISEKILNLKRFLQKNILMTNTKYSYKYIVNDLLMELVSRQEGVSFCL